MKKYLKYFSIMIMVLVLAVGCGKKEDPQKLLDEAFANMKDIESMSTKLTINMGINYEGTKLSMDMVMDMDMDKDDDVHGNYSISLFGYKQDMEMYIMTIDDYSYTYMKQPTGEWQYTKALVAKDEEETNKKEEMSKLFESMSDVKEVKSDKEGYTKLEVTADLKEVTAMLKEYKTEDVFPELDGELDITFSVYIKDGYVYIIEFDVTDILKQMSEEYPEEYPNDFSEVKMIIEYSNFNEINDIVVPQEVVDNAKEVIDEE